MINIWKAKGGKNMSIVYNLDVRCHEMLKYLLYQDGYTSITQLAEEQSSRETIESVKSKIFKTKTGIWLINKIF